MLLVADANIFIDFDSVGRIELLFCLDEQLAVPDLLFEEELRARHAHMLDLGLQLRELSGDQIGRVVDLTTRYRRVSANDISALVQAFDLSAPLLTGDRRLREAADAEGVEVRGTLWVVERLWSDGHLRVDEVDALYGEMRAAGRRLPVDEVQAQVRRMRTGSRSSG